MNIARLDKLMADSGAYSRSEARTLIRSGRVTVDGQIARVPEEKWDGDRVLIAVDGQPLRVSRFRYFLLHKPQGVLSATEDGRQETVLDLLPRELQRLGLFPVGRLDKDTTGLLLLTNDGDLAHRVISPKHHVSKRYRAVVEGVLGPEDVQAFARGLVLADGLECLPAQLRIAAPDVGLVTVYEGKYHQVKRMFASRGKPVRTLHRESVGALELPADLPAGAYRELSPAEIQLVFAGA